MSGFEPGDVVRVSHPDTGEPIEGTYLSMAEADDLDRGRRGGRRHRLGRARRRRDPPVRARRRARRLARVLGDRERVAVRIPGGAEGPDRQADRPRLIGRPRSPRRGPSRVWNARSISATRFWARGSPSRANRWNSARRWVLTASVLSVSSAAICSFVGAVANGRCSPNGRQSATRTRRWASETRIGAGTACAGSVARLSWRRGSLNAIRVSPICTTSPSRSRRRPRIRSSLTNVPLRARPSSRIDQPSTARSTVAWSRDTSRSQVSATPASALRPSVTGPRSSRSASSRSHPSPSR